MKSQLSIIKLGFYTKKYNKYIMRIKDIITESDDVPVLKLRNMGENSPAKRMIDKLYDEYEQNPLNEREIIIPMYGGVVLVTLALHSARTVHIEYFRTEPRRMGLGKAGLEFLQKVATEFDVELTANVDLSSSTPEHVIRKLFHITGFVEPANHHVDFIWRPEREL